MKVGDFVWTSYLDLGGYERRSRVRAEVVEVPEALVAGQRVRLRFSDGRIEARWSNQVEPYNAVDSLADLVRCRRCADFGHDRCAEHANTVRFSFGEVAATSETWTVFDAAVASNMDPVTRLGDVVREPERRVLSWAERLSRKKARKRTKRSRRRNR